jgi:hypothetical protein
MRKILFIILFAALHAAPVGAQPFPPPPDPQHFSSRPIHQNLLRWHDNLTTDCILAVRDDAQMNRIAGQISKHGQQPDQGIYADYFNKVLMPRYNALIAGVPGYGTYAEIDAKRQEYMKYLEEGLPKGPAGTEAEIRAFIAAYQAYAKRAVELRTWLMGLHKLSVCHREQRFEKTPLLGGFHNLNRFTDPAMVKHRLAERRDPLVPHFGGHGLHRGLLPGPREPEGGGGPDLLGRAGAVRREALRSPSMRPRRSTSRCRCGRSSSRARRRPNCWPRAPR